MPTIIHTTDKPHGLFQEQRHVTLNVSFAVFTQKLEGHNHSSDGSAYICVAIGGSLFHR
jgi:hypothetical protein